MSRLYSMEVTITGHDPAKAGEIQAAANKEWSPFQGNWDGDDREMTASGQGALLGGEGQRQLIERLAVAIWHANGDFCSIVGRTTCLEDLPYETHVLDKIDYDQSMGGKAAVAASEAVSAGEASDLNLLETFRCPDCQEKTDIEEVLADATVICRLHSVEADGRLNYDLPASQRNGRLYYQCAACGHMVAQSAADLFAGLRSMAKEAGVL